MVTNATAPTALTTSQRTALEWLRAGRSRLVNPGGSSTGWYARSPGGEHRICLTDAAVQELLDWGLVRRVAPRGGAGYPEYEPVCTTVADARDLTRDDLVGEGRLVCVGPVPGGRDWEKWPVRSLSAADLVAHRGEVLCHFGPAWDGLGGMPDPPSPAHVMARLADGLDPFPPGWKGEGL